MKIQAMIALMFFSIPAFSDDLITTMPFAMLEPYDEAMAFAKCSALLDVAGDVFVDTPEAKRRYRGIARGYALAVMVVTFLDKATPPDEIASTPDLSTLTEGKLRAFTDQFRTAIKLAVHRMEAWPERFKNKILSGLEKAKVNNTETEYKFILAAVQQCAKNKELMMEYIVLYDKEIFPMLIEQSGQE